MSAEFSTGVDREIGEVNWHSLLLVIAVNAFSFMSYENKLKNVCVSKEKWRSFVWTTSDTTSRVRIELLWINGFCFYDVAYEFPISPSPYIVGDECWWFISKHKPFFPYEMIVSISYVCGFFLHSILFGFKWKRNGENLWRCDNKLFSDMIFLLFNVVSSFLSADASGWVTYCMCRRDWDRTEGDCWNYNRPISKCHQ